MRTLDISTRLLSEVVWKKLLEAAAHRLIEKREGFFRLMASLEELRQRADYATGSISTASAWLLYCVANYFAPQRMLEVGAFIGKSALALALGSDDAHSGIELHTCDMSNAIDVPDVSKCRIRQYPRTSSTAMLSKLAADSAAGKFELLNVDGRLQAEDFPLLQGLCSAGPIVALDDFEGMEKGVANLINMRSSNFLPSHLLVYPCAEPLLQKFGFTDHSTVALLIPQSVLRLTSQ